MERNKLIRYSVLSLIIGFVLGMIAWTINIGGHPYNTIILISGIFLVAISAVGFIIGVFLK